MEMTKRRVAAMARFAESESITEEVLNDILTEFDKDGHEATEGYIKGATVITDKGSEESLREPEQGRKKKQRIMDVRSVVALVASTVPLLVTMILLIIAVIKF